MAGRTGRMDERVMHDLMNEVHYDMAYDPWPRMTSR